MHDKLMNWCFALKTFGVRVELPDWGVYEDLEGVTNAYPSIFNNLYHMHDEKDYSPDN